MASQCATQFVVIGLALLVGPDFCFTPYWRPVLYLVGVGLAAYLGVVWLLSGAEHLRFGLGAGATAVGFGLFALYCFVREERAMAEA